MPLQHFSELAHARASRNLVGLDELDAWLDGIGKEKLGVDERARKARAWLSTVAKKFMKRRGLAAPISEAWANELAQAHPWAANALLSGAQLHALALDPSEAADLSSILDWMRSADGPSPASDWSRVSWPQALDAHDKWVEQIGRQAERHLDGAKAFDGCERSVEIVGEPSLAGWSWVRPLTADALDREGALMRHCVGSYAKGVALDELQIWSLRDPAGHPRLTVETRPAKGGSAISQVKSFGNGPLGSAHALAIPALFSHLESIGLPPVEGSLDLWRGGLAVTPLGFGPAQLWRRGSADGASAALATTSQPLSAPALAEIQTMAKILGIVQYPAAMKALVAQAAQAALPLGELALIKAQAAKTGILLGAGSLSGSAIDRSSEADLLMCERACHDALDMPPSTERQSAILSLAAFFAQEGLAKPLRLLAPALVGEMTSPESQAALEQINQSLLDAFDPSFLGAPPLAGRPIWTSSPSLGSEALSAAELIAQKGHIGDGIKALSVFCRLGHAQAARALAKFIPLGIGAGGPLRDAALLARREIQRAGLALQLDPLGGARIWIPAADDARDALALALADPRSGNPILPIAINVGYPEAISAISLNIADADATAIALSLISGQIDAAAFGIRPTSSRLELEALRQASISRGFPKGALSALDALSALPDQCFDGPKHAQETRASYPRWRQIIECIESSVAEVESNPAFFRSLAPATRREAPGAPQFSAAPDVSILHTSPAWEALACKLSETHADMAGLFASCLKCMLACRAPYLADSTALLSAKTSSDTHEPSILSSTSRAISLFFSPGMDGAQRHAIIHAFVSLPAVGFKLSQRRVGSLAPMLSADIRPAPLGAQ